MVFNYAVKNLDKFKSTLTKYVPMYGGYCAYMVASGKKAEADPGTFEIRGSKLFLFYKSWGINNH